MIHATLNIHFTNHIQIKYTRVLLCWEREYLQAKLPLNTPSPFLIRDLVGHLLEFIKISLAPPMLKIDNFL